MNTIIEKIRAEVERLKKEHQEPTFRGDKYEEGGVNGYQLALDKVLAKLSSLEKEEKPIDKWSNKERKARVKKTGEIVYGFTDGQGHFDIPTDHNEFIRYNLDELEFDTLQEQPVMIEWTGNNLKEVIEFTGKSPRFDEWFKTWDEYESYVHSHGNIFKLFNEDGTHLEVPVGAWIFKTPDGRNVPSTFLYKEQPVCEGLEEEAESCWRIVFPDGGIETTKMALTHDEFMMCASHKLYIWKKVTQ